MARARRFAPGTIGYRMQQEGPCPAPGSRPQPAAPSTGNGPPQVHRGELHPSGRVGRSPDSPARLADSTTGSGAVIWNSDLR